MSINPRLLLLLSAALSASAKDKPFEAVEQSVKQRTKHEVTWERDLAAREESRARVHALLARPLTAASAVQIALLGNRGLQASFEEVGLSYADLREARTLANPEVELAVKLPERAATAPQYEWNIAQNFLSLLMLPLRTRIAQTNLAAAQMRVTDEVVKLVAEAKTAYYQVAADQQLVALLKVALEAQRSSLELMQKLHEAGNVSDLRLLQEQAQYSRVRVEVGTAEAQQRANREKLNRVLGLWGSDTEWKLAAIDLAKVPPIDFPVAGLENRAVANRLDLAAARLELESAVKTIGMEKAFRFVGTLDFGLAGEHDPDGAQLQGPSVRFALPIFNQGQARIARGEARVRMSAAKFEQLAIDVRSTIRELRDRLLTNRDTVAFYHAEVVPTRQQLTQETLAQYNAMLVGAFEAFQARKDDLEAQRTLIEAARDYWITRAELERAVGGDLEGAVVRHRVLATTESKTVLKPRKP